VDSNDILRRIQEAVVQGNSEEARNLAHEVIRCGMSVSEAIERGFSGGIQVVGDKYESKEYFVPEVLLSAMALKAGIEILKPHLLAGDEVEKGRVTICTIQGDIHDMGKNLVALMLEANGYDVNDLGRDVPIDRIIEEAKRHRSDVIAVSALMTTSMANMGKLIQSLEADGSRQDFKVAVGGAPLSQSYCERIGADIYAEDAAGAVNSIARALGA